MTSTWTDIPDSAVGQQITPELMTQIADDLDFLRNPPSGSYALSTGGANITTTSGTFVDLTGFSVSITTQGNPVEIFFVCRANTTNARFDILVNGVSITADNDGLGAVTPASTFGANTIWRRVALAAGTYTIKVQWRVTTGTGTVYAAGLAQLYVVERGPN